MALDADSEAQLALLPKSLLSIIKNIATISKTTLSATKVKKQAAVTSMDIALAPLSAKQAIYELAVKAAKESASVIPSDVAKGAPGLAQINTTVQSSLGSTTEAMENAIFEIKRLKAVKSAASAEISQIDARIQFFTDMEESISKILDT